MADRARHLTSLEAWSLPIALGFQKGLGEIEADRGMGIEDLRRAESQFFLTIWLPAMLLLGKCPAKLYQLSAAGDLSAVLELIRLDPFAVQLPAVQVVYGNLLRENDAAKLEAFRLAQGESVDLAASRSLFKSQFAARSSDSRRSGAELSETTERVSIRSTCGISSISSPKNVDE
ncbi:hypothetical protein [Planctomyces sp. SH-PL14]|uniref:hypothetical protein n=1 Tax=Planctomyces sp. SH-PL14 TaxID=1632864 RepID=UPI0012E828B5|nr:hypothetical protein [Planctomyces sp. SH-PL14]